MERPHPPKILYKYLSSNVVEDVLCNGTAKFTELDHTNDIFEVRKNFTNFGGPIFDKMLQQELLKSTHSKEEYYKKEIARQIKANLPLLSRKERRKLSSQHKKNTFPDFKELMQLSVGQFADFSRSDTINHNIIQILKSMLCYSLSEGYDIPSMWAHYASNNQGFVIGFDTNHEWFKNNKNSLDSRLHKVKYFDGVLNEFMDDPYLAISSKLTCWSNEKEWRIYSKLQDIETSLQTPAGLIHLISFPPEMVLKIIIGAKASIDTENQISSIKNRRYPHAQLFKAAPTPEHYGYQLISFPQ